MPRPKRQQTIAHTPSDYLCRTSYTLLVLHPPSYTLLPPCYRTQKKSGARKEETFRKEETVQGVKDEKKMKRQKRGKAKATHVLATELTLACVGD
jgi:hypothetical protein